MTTELGSTKCGFSHFLSVMIARLRRGDLKTKTLRDVTYEVWLHQVNITSTTDKTASSRQVYLTWKNGTHGKGHSTTEQTQLQGGVEKVKFNPAVHLQFQSSFIVESETGIIQKKKSPLSVYLKEANEKGESKVLAAFVINLHEHFYRVDPAQMISFSCLGEGENFLLEASFRFTQPSKIEPSPDKKRLSVDNAKANNRVSSQSTEESQDRILQNSSVSTESEQMRTVSKMTDQPALENTVYAAIPSRTDYDSSKVSTSPISTTVYAAIPKEIARETEVSNDIIEITNSSKYYTFLPSPQQGRASVVSIDDSTKNDVSPKPSPSETYNSVTSTLENLTKSGTNTESNVSDISPRRSTENLATTPSEKNYGVLYYVHMYKDDEFTTSTTPPNQVADTSSVSEGPYGKIIQVRESTEL